MMELGSSAFWLTIVSMVAVSVVFGMIGGFAASKSGSTVWEAVEAGFRRFGAAMTLGILFAGFIVGIAAANAALKESQKDCRPSAAAMVIDHPVPPVLPGAHASAPATMNAQQAPGD